MTVSKELVAAYADGELEGDALREVALAVAGDPALQADVDAHRHLRAQLTAHFAPVVEEPLPPRLTALLAAGERQDNVIDLAEAARARRGNLMASPTWKRMAGPALAATLVLAIIGLGLHRQDHAGYADAQLAAALDRQLVETQSPQAPVRILLSFRDQAGRYCRGFSSAARSGIACNDGTGWKLGAVAHGGTPEPGEYRQAESADAQVLAKAQDLADGPALDAKGEREAVRANWRPGH